MVVGNGMIAKRFADYENDDRYIIFASGVSNSSTKVAEDFEREISLIQNVIASFPQKCIVYFSTCSIYDASLASSLYVQHKLLVEALIKEKANSYIIFRVSNPVGFTNNPHTVLNYFIHHITQKIPFQLWENAERNLIDIDDMFLICSQLLSLKSENRTYNIANTTNYPVRQIVSTIETHFSVEGIYKSISKGNSPYIDTSAIISIISEYSIDFDKNYLAKLLKKYYRVDDLQTSQD